MRKDSARGVESKDMGRVSVNACSAIRDSIGVGQGVGESSFFESLQPELARVAMAAGNSFRGRIVTAMCQSVIDSELCACLYDLRLGHGDQGSVDSIGGVLFDSCLGGEVRERLEGFDVFGATVGVAAVIDGIHADKQVEGFHDFGPAESGGEKDGVACGDVGGGDSGGHFVLGSIFGDVDGSRECGARKRLGIELVDDVLFDASCLGDFFRRFEFKFVSLAVIEGDGVAVEALFPREGESGGGIESSTEQNDGICSIDRHNETKVPVLQNSDKLRGTIRTIEKRC